MKQKLYVLLSAMFLGLSCSGPASFDVLIVNAMIYDGSGGPAYLGMVGINADTIAEVGVINRARGTLEVDANGMAVSPGFVNMLSWATESLIYDGRGMSDIQQGVTLEVMGEGWSMGPLTEEMAVQMREGQGDIEFEITWRTLGEYLTYLEESGISPNVASFVGATTLRIHEIGYEDRPPTAEELENMIGLAREAMEEGAMGIGSSLIYAPAFYAERDELVELCRAVQPYGGMYITHMRSEGNKILEAVDEVFFIAREAEVPAEIYHLKMAGQNNWDKYDEVVRRIEAANESGLRITTDMYTYVAGATGLDASMPPWVQEGGYDAWAGRLTDPAIRKKVASEMKVDAEDWENLYAAAGDASNLLLVGFKEDSLKKYTGKSLAEVAEIRGTTPEETAMDLVIEDGSRVGTVYFLMSEENVKKQIQLPFMTFGSDAGAPATEGPFLMSNPHPRAYGNFARLLGKYVREEEVISLEEAIMKLTSRPCENLKIEKRGRLQRGFFADIVIFNAQTISDHATFESPHQYATGVHHVFVNGEHVIRDGQHTGAKPGRFVKGPGYRY